MVINYVFSRLVSRALKIAVSNTGFVINTINNPPINYKLLSPIESSCIFKFSYKNKIVQFGKLGLKFLTKKKRGEIQHIRIFLLHAFDFFSQFVSLQENYGTHDFTFTVKLKLETKTCIITREFLLFYRKSFLLTNCQSFFI